MRKYIKSILKDNSFQTLFSLNYNGKIISGNNIYIDTGCTNTLISADILYGLNSNRHNENEIEKLRKELHGLKAIALSSNIEHTHGIGVSNLYSSDSNLLNDTSVRFREQVTNIEICGVKISNQKVNISYDSLDIAVIGMDIMKDWDIHIGKVTGTQETILLACPYDKINEDYLKALEDHFSISTKINSILCNERISNKFQ